MGTGRPRPLMATVFDLDHVSPTLRIVRLNMALGASPTCMMGTVSKLQPYLSLSCRLDQVRELSCLAEQLIGKSSG